MRELAVVVPAGRVLATAPRAPGPRVVEPKTLPEILAAHERLIIIEALARCGGSRTRAAAALGIRRERLHRRIQFLKIDVAAVQAAVGYSKKTRKISG